MDLGAIKQAANAALTESASGNLEDLVLHAAGALPADASDFDRGMAAGFAAAMVLRLQSENEQKHSLSLNSK